jgi:hypothetical protein
MHTCCVCISSKHMPSYAGSMQSFATTTRSCTVRDMLVIILGHVAPNIWKSCVLKACWSSSWDMLPQHVIEVLRIKSMLVIISGHVTPACNGFLKHAGHHFRTCYPQPVTAAMRMKSMLVIILGHVTPQHVLHITSMLVIIVNPNM